MHRGTMALLWAVLASLITTSLVLASCKRTNPKAKVSATDPDDVAEYVFGNDFKDLVKVEKIYAEAKSGRKTTKDALQSLDELLAKYSKKISDNDLTPYTSSVLRQISSRYIELKSETSQNQIEAVASDHLSKYWGGCYDYPTCGQMLSRLAQIVTIVPDQVYKALVGPTSQVATNPEAFKNDDNKYPLLDDFDTAKLTPNLRAIIHFMYRSLRATAVYYSITGLGKPHTFSLPISLNADQIDTLQKILASIQDDTFSTWICPSSEGSNGLANLSKLQNTLLEEFGTLAKDDGAKAYETITDPDIRNTLDQSITHIANAIFRTIQNNMTLQLYLQRHQLGSIRDWNKMMKEVDIETALMTYVRFMNYELTQPSRAIYAQSIFDLVKASPIATSRDGQSGKRSDFALWQMQADLLAQRFDDEIRAFLERLNLSKINDPDVTSCSRAQSEAKAGRENIELPQMLRCEEALINRSKSFRSFAWQRMAYDGALARFQQTSATATKDAEEASKKSTVRKWLDSMEDTNDAYEWVFKGIRPHDNPNTADRAEAIRDITSREMVMSCHWLTLKSNLPKYPTGNDPRSEGVTPPESSIPKNVRFVPSFGLPTEVYDLRRACFEDKASYDRTIGGGEPPNFDVVTFKYLNQTNMDTRNAELNRKIQGRIFEAVSVLPVAGAATWTTAKLASLVARSGLSTMLNQVLVGRMVATLTAKATEAALFSVYQKLGTAGLTYYQTGEVKDAAKVIWDQDLGYWENFGESLATGTALFFIQPWVGKYLKPNESIGKLVGIRNSEHFKNVSMWRKGLYGTLAIGADNLTFASSNVLFKVVESAAKGDPVNGEELFTAFLHDNFHMLPVTMTFRAAHGVGGHWSNGPSQADLRIRGRELLRTQDAINKTVKIYADSLENRREDLTRTKAFILEREQKLAAELAQYREMMTHYLEIDPRFVALKGPAKSKAIADYIMQLETNPIMWWLEFRDPSELENDKVLNKDQIKKIDVNQPLLPDGSTFDNILP